MPRRSCVFGEDCHDSLETAGFGVWDASIVRGIDVILVNLM